METMLRNAFQLLGRSRTANLMARKYGLRLGAGRFVAGQSVEQAIQAVRKLNAEGMKATLDHLGEFVGTGEEAAESARMCIRTLEAIADSGVDSNLSLKLTSLGLDLGEDLCMRNMRTILETARKYGNFVRIDMEDSSHCQMTLDLFRRLRSEYENVGVVIQAYLYRSGQDVEDLKALRANLRLVKGAYKEPPAVAFPHKNQVDDNFRKIIRQQLESGNYAAIATHDETVVEDMIAFIRERGIPNDAFEFQMLYGIAEHLQRRLVREGYRVRIYVPYGADWFGYFMRRLAERPANVWFVMKNWFRK
ncbi:proline dehydrogenase [Cohnella sp. CFH 77786]|uniref:proline dehydrogenase family protein n=1 Tax=Cohnella sp. CFH 77786 TaxID=2662265 RepID=UPI001C610DF7|nr:proline dehydrogenase [Cohnella sp. CFH 77786]MBW5448267.1 proline dehydrogenase [Cohnella sp. CFH 77786]